MRTSPLFIALVLILLPSVALALMPPHVDGTNIKDGVLVGNALILRGYSLKYTDVKKDLSLTYAKTKRTAAWTHKMDCQWEGKCDEDSRPGSCQLACVLTVSLDQVKAGTSLQLKYLDVNQTFQLKAAKKKKN